MLPTFLRLIPTKALVIGTALSVAIVGGGLYARHWHNQKVAEQHKAYVADLDKRTQDAKDNANKLEGQIAQLQVTVAEKETKLQTANQKLAASLGKPLPPMPDPPPTADPCAEVRKVAQEREGILTDQRDSAIAAKTAAEEVLPPLKEQLKLETAAKLEYKAGLDLQVAKVSTITLDLDKANDRAFKWKVGGITVGVVGLTYILLHH